jgi:hypothetical protein
MLTAVHSMVAKLQGRTVEAWASPARGMLCSSVQHESQPAVRVSDGECPNSGLVRQAALGIRTITRDPVSQRRRSAR